MNYNKQQIIATNAKCIKTSPPVPPSIVTHPLTPSIFVPYGSDKDNVYFYKKITEKVNLCPLEGGRSPTGKGHKFLPP